MSLNNRLITLIHTNKLMQKVQRFLGFHKAEALQDNLIASLRLNAPRLGV